ncbi:MAG: hypothetical protein MUC43_16605 [Pirellula sp.]|nr:hypothetical protein [Pirellula sp.]
MFTTGFVDKEYPSKTFLISRKKSFSQFPDPLNAINPRERAGSTAMIYSENIPDQIDENDSSEQTEYRSLVHRAMKQVRSEFEARSWQAFWRTTVDGIGVDQVAEELQMSKATIRQHRSRVLRRLRQQLGEIE